MAARPDRLLQRWASLVALLLCVGHSVADTHVHLDEHDEHEEEVCTLCAIFEPGYAPDVEWDDTRPSESGRSSNWPLDSAVLPPRAYEAGQPRAPPFSVS